jgi:dTDP-3,4-didehydro-2,6-dideoxy-alpha-D-glucose 3-reductase
MRLLILGYSAIAQRRLIPAAAQATAIDEISIAGKSCPRSEGWPKSGHFFDVYEAALQESEPDIVYVSLPNAMHEYWCWLRSPPASTSSSTSRP